MMMMMMMIMTIIIIIVIGFRAMGGTITYHGKQKHSVKLCPNVTLFTTNLTLFDFGTNLGRRRNVGC
jgi:hypothetical protein